MPPPELRWYQRRAIEKTHEYLCNNKSNPCIVLPTGAGKSILMAAMIREYLSGWPDMRIAVVAHVKELVQQNHDKTLRYWPDAPAGTFGINSASLGRRDTKNPVIFANIQSIFKSANKAGPFDLILVDEAHRIPISGEGMYRMFLGECQELAEHLRVVGLTATPYRLSTGRITGPDYTLNAISYEISVKDLITEGFLCKLISKGGRTQADISGVHIKQGEYVASELEAAMNTADLVQGAVNEMLHLADDRKAWIVFAAGIDHAYHICRRLKEAGVSAEVVEGDTPRLERDRIIARFQSGELRALVNINVLSEGFDATHIDAVMLLRPTESPGLYYQQVGRGLRLHPGKQDCLILDFAGNVMKHGPIDQIEPRTKSSKSGTDKEAPYKECPNCQRILHASVMACECGYLFPIKPKHGAEALGGAIISEKSSPSTIRSITSSTTNTRNLVSRRVFEWTTTKATGVSLPSGYVLSTKAMPARKPKSGG